MLRMNLLCFRLCPLFLVLLLDATEDTLTPSSSHPPFRYLQTLTRFLWSFSSPGWTAQLSRLVITAVLHSFHRWNGPVLDSLQYIHISYTEEPKNWTQHPKCSFTSAELKGRITKHAKHCEFNSRGECARTCCGCSTHKWDFSYQIRAERIAIAIKATCLFCASVLWS